MDALGVQENFGSEAFHNIIVNIFDVILEDSPIFLLYDIPQLEPNHFLKVNSPVRAQLSSPVCVKTI